MTQRDSAPFKIHVLPPVASPTWVGGANAWEWAEIPGTRFDDYLEDDGTGILPGVTSDPMNTQFYQIWGNYVGTAYSYNHHEVYLRGGGHAQTANNLTVRWNLNQDLPDVSVVNSATPDSVRISTFGNSGYFPAGSNYEAKPYVAHTYRTLQFVDGIDELLQLGMTFYDMSADSLLKVAGLERSSGVWRADGYWPDLDASTNGCGYGACFRGADGSGIYWSNMYDGTMFKLDPTTRSHLLIGGGGYHNFKQCADGGQGTALGFADREADVSNGRGPIVINLGTGTSVSPTISGDSFDESSYACFGVEWVATVGAYVAVFTNARGVSGTGGVSYFDGWWVYKYTPSGANSFVRELVPTTGTPPVGEGNRQGVFYDPSFGGLVIATGHTMSFKFLKVG